MDDRTLRLRLGFVVLAAVITTALLINQFGDLPVLGRGRYTVYILFPEAPGVSVDTPVRKSGVTIGRVTKWELMQPFGVRVTTSIDSAYQILDTEVCRINTASVLGDAILEFVQGPTTTTAGKPLVDGSVIQTGVVAGNPLQVIVNMETDIRRMMRSIESAGGEIRMVAQNMNNTLGNNKDQFPRVLQKAERAMDQFTSSMAKVEDIFGDPESRMQLRDSMKDLPELIKEARAAVARSNEAFDNFGRVAKSAETTFLNLENFTRPLGQRGENIVTNLEGSLANANELLEQLVEFSDNLNNNEGSIGKLMNDPELYNRLNRVLANTEDATRRVRPILDDLRVFSDKLARDPRQLGVKGALDRRPSGTGFKNSVYDQTIYFYEEE